MMRPVSSIKLLSVIVLVITVASLCPAFLTGHSPMTVTLVGCQAPDRNHLCGTDHLGRDVLSRAFAAGRISIAIGCIARLGTVIAGCIIGILVGLSAGSVRFALNNLVEVFLAIPSLLLAMGLAVVLGEGYTAIVIAIMAGTWAPVARFIAVRVGEIRERDYVLAAQAIGAGQCWITIRHILPSLLPSLLPVMTTGIAASIMMESTLTFLGLGGSASLDKIPSWGILIQEGSKFIFDAPWLMLPSSLLLTVVIVCFNQIGDGLSDWKKDNDNV